MGRHRTKNHHLPHRVYEHHGSYWYRPLRGKPRKLARLEDYNAVALEQHESIIPEFSLQKHVNELFMAARCSSAVRKRSFDLSKADVQKMLKDANYRCSVSGIPFSYERIPGVRIRPWIPSIDRLDNNLGYSISNCRLVCAYVNIAMNVFGLDALHKVMRYMRDHKQANETHQIAA